MDLRDYDAVAESLPVFCVSSRAFQGLSGRLQKDNVDIAGFQDLSDTEIPQLQAHAKKVTEQGRIANSRRFLTDLSLLINSLVMWADSDGSRIGYTDAEKRKAEAFTRRELLNLQMQFRDAAAWFERETMDMSTDQIHSTFNQSIPAAIEAAVPTASSWGACPSEGGLVWSTYKATVRREGEFSGASGPRDFNADLFKPISVRLASGWERAF